MTVKNTLRRDCDLNTQAHEVFIRENRFKDYYQVEI